jgi:surface protein
MFQQCTSLTTLDVSNWNVGAVTNMYAMFYNCTALTTLNVSNWNVGAVTNMQQMFQQCTSLATLNVSNWNVGAVTNMQQMFNGVILKQKDYDAFLVKLALTPLRQYVQLDYGSHYTQNSSASTARQYVITNYGWTINDSGPAAALPGSPPPPLGSRIVAIF